MKKKLLLTFLFSLSILLSFGQSRNVNGKVLDSDSVSIPGVNVIVTGTNIGTVTDFDGNFSLDVPNENNNLTFSFVGYETQQVSITDSNDITVVMEMSQNQLEEVVVIGYGSQRKEDATGAVERVTAKDFNAGTAIGVNELIRGKVAGLNISSPGSDPTRGPTVQIRGPSTINGGDSAPFYVLDGVPGASLAGVAPQDIESIDVLKDAASTAIYGSRAANGVIIVTTKRAKAGNSFLRFNSFVGIEKPQETISVANAKQLKDELGRQGFTLADSDDLGFDTNWQDEITQTGVSQNYNLSFGGGSDKSSFTASLSYVDLEGVVKTSASEQLRGRIRTTTKLFDDRLHIDFSLLGSTITNHEADYDVFYQALQYLPTVPVYNDDGTFYQVPSRQEYYNPVSLLEERERRVKFTTLTAMGKVNYKILEDLEFEFNSVLQNNRNDLAMYDDMTYIKEPNNGYLERRTTEGTTTTMELLLKYNKSFNEDHVLDLLGGYTWQKNTFNDGLSAQTQNFFTDRLGIYGLNYGSPGTNYNYLGNPPGYGESTLISFLGRAIYNFKNKYIFQGAIRQDGSSRFGENNKWATFPSASFAWKMGEEDFLKNSNTISAMKLRIGWGVSGNQEGIGTNLSNVVYTRNGTVVINDTPVSVFSQPHNANPDLRWEKTTTFNFGVDFGFLNDRITGSIDLYDKNTTDLLFTYSVPVPPNFVPTTIGNGGEINNKGLEFALNGRVIEGKDFGWNANFNISFNRNEVVNLDSDFPSPEEIRIGSIPGRAIPGSTAQIIRPGEPLGTFFMNDYLYINENGNRVYRGRDGGELIGDDAGINDYFIVGNAQPDFIWNFGSQFNYKRFYLTFLLRGMHGHEIFNATRMNTTRLNGAELLNYNVNTMAIKEGILDGPKVSDYFLEDGSYLRLDNLTFGYNLPDNNFYQSASVFVTAENLFTITDYSGVDPEINLNTKTPGIESTRPLWDNPSSGAVYYRATTFTLGVSVNF